MATLMLRCLPCSPGVGWDRVLVLTHVASVGNSMVCLQEARNPTAGGVCTEAGSLDSISQQPEAHGGGGCKQT